MVTLALVLAAAQVSEIAAGFWSKDLGAARGAFERVLVQDGRPQGEVEGGALHFWTELFDLVDCVPLNEDQRLPFVPRNDWEWRIGLVRLERMRLLRTGRASPLAKDLSDPQYFVRLQSELPDEVVAWPPRDEAWSDEVVRPEPRASNCEALSGLSSTAAKELAKEELALAEALLQANPEAAPLRWHVAALLLALRETDRVWPVIAPFATAEAVPAPARLLGAMWLDHQADPTAAARYAALAGDPDVAPEEAFIRVHAQAGLAAQGRWDELLEVVPAQPDLRDPVGRYQAFLRAKAFSALGRMDALLDHARWVLRSATEAQAKEAPLVALADLEYAFLATAPFDERVVELVESLGEPRLVYARIGRLARVALDRGRFAAARAAWSWLLVHHQVAEYHPRYRAGLADVAYTTGDLPVFKAFLRELTTPAERLAEAIPPVRRGAFFQERDRQVLVLARGLVPRLAERGDDRWTGAFVDLVQEFLRAAPENRSAAALTDLYRTARALLDGGAKAYAERIGSKAPELVLGEVDLERIVADPAPPQVPASLHEPGVLLRIPTGGEGSPWRPWFGGAP